LDVQEHPSFTMGPLSIERRAYYFGHGRISEGDFLRIAGYDSEPADEFHAKNRSLVLRAFSLLGIGIAAVSIGVLADDRGVQTAFTTAGLIIAPCSFVPAIRRRSRRDYYLPLYEATSIAQEYNGQ
jgi:hypothetical protein